MSSSDENYHDQEDDKESTDLESITDQETGTSAEEEEEETAILKMKRRNKVAKLSGKSRASVATSAQSAEASTTDLVVNLNDIKKDHENRPLWISSDLKIYFESFSPFSKQVRKQPSLCL